MGAEREPRWDSVRFVAATVVLVGHAVTPLRHFGGISWVELSTWGFGVPAFALMSGRFSTALPLTFPRAKRLAQTILLPYAAVSLATTLQIWLLRGTVEFFVVEPVATLWFLLSLLFWRAALPYVATLRHPFTLSVLAALAIGYAADVGFAYSASQTITFFPFFLAGWKLSPDSGNAWAGRALDACPRWVAVAAVAAPFAAVWPLRSWLERGWLSMGRAYHLDGFPFDAERWGPAFRLAVLAWGLLASLALVRAMPARAIPLITYLGTGGLFIYLLHPLILRQLYHVDFFSRVDTGAKAAAVLAAAVLSAAVLGSAPVRRLTGPLIQPRARWLFRDAPADSAAPESSSPPVPAGVRLPPRSG